MHLAKMLVPHEKPGLPAIARSRNQKENKMTRFVKQNPETQVIEHATMQAMAAGVSNTEDVACTGKYVVLITTVNGGGSQHYNLFDSFGEDVVSALHEADAAFTVLEPARFEELVYEVANDFNEGGVLDVQIHVFQFGNLVAYYETVV